MGNQYFAKFLAVLMSLVLLSTLSFEPAFAQEETTPDGIAIEADETSSTSIQLPQEDQTNNIKKPSETSPVSEFAIAAVQLANGDVQVTVAGKYMSAVMNDLKNGRPVYIGTTQVYFNSHAVNENILTLNFSRIWSNEIEPGQYDLQISCYVNTDEGYRSLSASTPLSIKKGISKPPTDVRMTQNTDGDVIITSADTTWIKKIRDVGLIPQNPEIYDNPPFWFGEEETPIFYVDGGNLVIPFSQLMYHKIQVGEKVSLEIDADEYYQYKSGSDPLLTISKGITNISAPQIDVQQLTNGDIEFTLQENTPAAKAWWDRAHTIVLDPKFDGNQVYETYFSMGDSPSKITKTDTKMTLSYGAFFHEQIMLQSGEYELRLECRNTNNALGYYENAVVNSSFNIKALPELPFPIKIENSEGNLVIKAANAAQNEEFTKLFSTVYRIVFYGDKSAAHTSWIDRQPIYRGEMTFGTDSITIPKETLLANGIYSGNYQFSIEVESWRSIATYPVGTTKASIITETDQGTIPSPVDIKQQANGDIIVSAPDTASGKKWIQNLDNITLNGTGVVDKSLPFYQNIENQGNCAIIPYQWIINKSFRDPEAQVVVYSKGYPVYTHTSNLVLTKKAPPIPSGITMKQLSNGDIALTATGSGVATWLKDVNKINFEKERDDEAPDNEWTGTTYREDFLYSDDMLIIPYQRAMELGFNVGSNYTYEIHLASQIYSIPSASLEAKSFALIKGAKSPPQHVSIYQNGNGDMVFAVGEYDSWINEIYEIEFSGYWGEVVRLSSKDFSVTQKGKMITVPYETLVSKGIGNDNYSLKITMNASGYASLVRNGFFPSITIPKSQPDGVSVSHVEGEGIIVSAPGEDGASWIANAQMITIFPTDDRLGNGYEIHERSFIRCQGSLLIPEYVLEDYLIKKNARYELHIMSAGFTAPDNGIQFNYVLDVPISSIELSAIVGPHYVNSGVAVSATTQPADALAKNIRWYIDDVYKPEYNGKSVIYVTKASVGSLAVKAVDSNNSLITDTLTLTFSSGTVKQITDLNINLDRYRIDKGDNVTIEKTILPTDATVKELEWTSDNEDVAIVDANGQVTGKGYGQATITAKAQDGSGKTTTCIVTVGVEKPVTKLTFGSTSYNLQAGKTMRMLPTVAPADASKNILKWKSSNLGAATVDTDGTVTGIGRGMTRITAMATDGSGVVASYLVNVVEPVNVTDITLNKGTLTLLTGKSDILIPSIYPSNMANKAVTWSSDNTLVAIVDSSGKVTARVKGTATITVKSVDGQKTATCKVTVLQAVTTIKLNKTAATIYPAAPSNTVQLSAATYPANAYNRGVMWTSSNTSVAKISATGLVTGVKKGSAFITVMAKDGSGVKATCKITVLDNRVAPAKIRSVKTTNVGRKKIKVSWSKTFGASGYVVYRATSRGGKYKAIKTLKSGNKVSYINGKLKSKKIYYYKVRAYRIASGKRVYGKYSSIVKRTAK